ncbi:fimbrial protein [Salmonella enterica]|nr:fimbrial protein [Salmonella enterica]
MRLFLWGLIIYSNVMMINHAHADYFTQVDINDVGYDLDYFTIPDNAGENTGGFHDNGSTVYRVEVSDDVTAYVELSINGTLLGDGVTWATSNPGIGIQYRFESGSNAFTPASSEQAPDYRLDLKGKGVVRTSYFHLRYRLVRLLDKIPPGKITTMPQVTMLVHNPSGSDTSLFSGVVLSKISSQLTVVACTIDAPTEIKLPTLYGNTINNGALNITEAPTVTLKNCPGAINGISYEFAASYGTHKASNGVLNTLTGEGYAENVYVQLQNADGTAHKINSPIALSDYNGSGDYEIPNFKVAYYVDDAETVRPGNVKTAIDLKVTYN